MSGIVLACVMIIQTFVHTTIAQTIDFYGKGLTLFPTNVSVNTTHLNLGLNSIQYVPQEILKTLTSVEILNLGHNKLDSVGNLTEVGDTLQNLVLYNNPDIKEIPDTFWSHFPLLDSLNIASTGLAVLPTFTDALHQNLKWLKMGGNPFANPISREFLCSFQHLNYLDITNTGLAALPDLSGCPILDTLTDLIISHNPLIFHEAALIPFQSLRFLTLVSLGLTEIPNLQLLPDSLVFLNIHHNPSIKDIRPNYLQLNNLIYLYMADAGLKTLSGIRGRSLNYLDVRQNEFVSLNATDFAGLPKLTGINLDSTSLFSFPDFGTICSTLAIVYMNQNEINVLPFEVLKKMAALTRLYANFNLLETLPNMHMAAPNLEHIELRHNLFTRIPNLGPSVKIVDLRSNAITHVYAHDLESSLNLETLKLSDNNLVRISDIAYGSLQSLSVSGNPNLDLCGCEHAWMKLALDRNLVLTVTDLTCPGAHASWTNANFTFTSLGSICNEQADGYKSGWGLQRSINPTCSYRAFIYHPSVHLNVCNDKCIKSPKCVGVLFLPLGGSTKGDCQLLSASVTAVVNVPNAGDAGWQCYVIDKM